VVLKTRGREGGFSKSGEPPQNLWERRGVGCPNGCQRLSDRTSEDVRSDIRGCPNGHQRMSDRTSGCPFGHRGCPIEIRGDIDVRSDIADVPNVPRMSVRTSRMSVRNSWGHRCPFGHPGDIWDIRMSERTSGCPKCPTDVPRMSPTDVPDVPRMSVRTLEDDGNVPECPFADPWRP
jgi:hypothetical protein